MKMDNKSRIGIVRARESIRPSKRRVYPSYIPEEQIRIAHALRTACDTESILSNKGWCLWQCELLGNDVIAIVRDDSVHEVPGRYVTYTESELRHIFTSPLSHLSLRIIHQAKRCEMLQSRHFGDGFGVPEDSEEIDSTNSSEGMNLAMALS